MTHTILFLAANPRDTLSLALDQECAEIERELRMTSGRADFVFESRWAVSIDDLMRHLNEHTPAIVHFSGHGGAAGSGRRGPAGALRDVSLPDDSPPAGAKPAPSATGIWLQDGNSSQFVSDRALAAMLAAASPSTRLVVLNACYTSSVAEALRRHVDCVVGMDGAIADVAARSFAVAFYRALGNRRSIGNAVAQSLATLAAKNQDDVKPICTTREGLVADKVFLSEADSAAGAGPAVAAPSRLTPDQLLTRLSRLLPAQFETVVFRLRIPTAYLAGGNAPQASRAIELLRYAEQQGALDQLAQILDDVMR
jgi:hypothetical protein